MAGTTLRTALRHAPHALAALIIFAALVVSALALTFPTLTGRVVDEAGILNAAARQSLDAKLADLEAKTTDQLVVVTLKSLQGAEIADYGYQLGRHWQIGQAGKNNGALLIVAPSERKVRIEVGYGLEGVLTDAAARVIIEDAILPRFRAGDFPGGVAAGVDAIVKVLTGDPEWQQRAAQPAEQTPDWVTILIILFALLMIGIVAYSIVSGAMGTGRGGRGAWASGSAGGAASGSSWSSGSSSGGFSGGGGSFGGGGSSGSW